MRVAVIKLKTFINVTVANHTMINIQIDTVLYNCYMVITVFTTFLLLTLLFINKTSILSWNFFLSYTNILQLLVSKYGYNQ